MMVAGKIEDEIENVAFEKFVGSKSEMYSPFLDDK